MHTNPTVKQFTRRQEHRFLNAAAAAVRAEFPNPERLGCPSVTFVRNLAHRQIPLCETGDLVDHIGTCAPCLDAYRSFRRRSLWVRAASAAAAVIAVIAISGIYAERTLRIGPWSSGTESILLDYRNESVSRSEAGESERTTRALPRKKLDLMILPPIGSESGDYDLRLVANTGQVVLHRSMVGRMENFELRMRTNVDLRSLTRGSYLLEIRRAGEDWDPHPVLIR
jgi:hypothetical protein